MDASRVVDDALLEVVRQLLAAADRNIVTVSSGGSIGGASESLRRTERELQTEPSMRAGTPVTGTPASAVQAASCTSGAGRQAHPARSFMPVTHSTTDKTMMLCNCDAIATATQL